MSYIESIRENATKAAKARALDDMVQRDAMEKQYQKGAYDKEAEIGMQQSKADVAMQIYKGNPQEAGMATKFAMETGLLNGAELKGIVDARMVEEQALVPKLGGGLAGQYVPEPTVGLNGEPTYDMRGY